MTTIYNLTGVKACNKEVGIEIEVEATRDVPSAKKWRTEQDGSLRGPFTAEYVTKPIMRNEVKEYLDSLRDDFKAVNSEVRYTIRAGVHVHVNCQDMTLMEMLTFASVYYIMEDALTQFCGEDRAGNHFCLRISDTDYVIDRIVRCLQEDHIGHLHTDNIRYSALNYNALFKYGTLEFRAMATLPNFEKVEEWIDILMGLKDYSKNFGSPADVVEAFSMKTPRGFCQEALGMHYDTIFPDGATFNTCIQGMRAVQDIANWRFL